MIINTKKECRVCGSSIQLIADMGEIHINDFPEKPTTTLGKAPLMLDECTECGLVQLRHTIDPDILYGEHYWYESGLNSKLKKNLLDIAEFANEHTEPGDIILDIGANDGTLLSGVKKDRIRIGCEPARNLQTKLKKNCDEIINDLWHHDHMNERKAKFITAIGMFYDLDDPNEFINSVNEALADDGIFVAQLMTLAPMLKMKDVGNVCHEHLEYYSYKSLKTLYENNGLEIFDVFENDIQGGSYQIWARKKNEGSIDYYENNEGLEDFFSKVIVNGRLLKALLTDLKSQGKKCYVYGASTKGNTMLQMWDLGGVFDGAAEIHPDKVGRYTVGTGIPIIDENEARENADVFFVPNFGFRDMFVEKEKEWIDNGGMMVFAMPEVSVVKKEET